MSLDRNAFRAALGRFASGITIVTTRDAAGADCGMTVSAFCSVSLEPPLVLVSIGHDASMYAAVRDAAHFGINILADGQEALSRRFSSRETADRFAGVGFQRADSGVALLDDVLCSLECRTVARHEAGDHTLLIGETLAAHVAEGRPLLYYRGGYAQLER
jgi:flavin reductase (DIM6/NTAB) family NADH-FMN oxidoreductase RutF